jgi:glutathione S-transferase
VLVEGDFTLPDSSVICRYLEDAYPEPALYPRDLRARARACWIEEYADTKLTECLAPLAGERLFKPAFMKQPTDEANVARILDELLPEPLAYLESIAPETGFACGDFSIADIALGAAFTNARYARFKPDPRTHPRLRALLDRAWTTPVFAARLAIDRADYAQLLG